MTAKNDITGDLIKSRVNSKEFSENFDRIFGVKQEKLSDEMQSQVKANALQSGVKSSDDNLTEQKRASNTPV